MSHFISQDYEHEVEVVSLVSEVELELDELELLLLVFTHFLVHALMVPSSVSMTQQEL